MNETELERLVVRLVGDATLYERMCTQAQTATQQTAAVVDQSMRVVQGFQKTLEGFARSAVGALGMFGFATSMHAVFDRFTQYEQEQIRLTSAIKTNGKEVQTTTAEYMKLADQLKATVLISKNAVLSMARMAEIRGLTTEQSKDAVKMSVALAGAMGGEAQQHMHLAVAIMEGNTHMLRRALRLHNIHDESLLLAKAQKLLQSGWEIEQARAQSLGGQVERLQRSFRYLSLEVGKLVAEFLRPLIDWVERNVDKFNSMDDATKKLVITITALALAVPLVGPAMALLSRALDLVLAPLYSIVSFGMSLMETVFNVALVVASTAAWLAWKTVVFVASLALLALKGTIALVSLMYAGLNFLLGLSNIQITMQTLVVVDMWVAWLVAKGVMLAWNAVWAIFNATMIVGGAIMGIWVHLPGAMSLSQLLAKAATWAWNASLVVLNALLSAGVLLIPALAAAFLVYVAGATAIVAVTTAFAAAITGAWTVLQSFISSISSFGVAGAAIGPLVNLIGLFNQWKGVVYDLYRAVQVDLPLAWEMARAAFELALAQMRALWPPLWELIKNGASATWTIVKFTFLLQMNEAIAQFKREFILALNDMLPTLDTIGQAIWKVLTDPFKSKDAVAEAEAAAEAADTAARITDAKIKDRRMRDIAAAKEALKDLGKDFKIPVEAEGPIKEAEAKIDELRKRLDKAWDDSKKKKEKEPFKLPNIPHIPDQKVKVKLDASQFGSAEALHKIHEYMDKLGIEQGIGQIVRGEKPNVGGGAEEKGAGAPPAPAPVKTFDPELWEEKADIKRQKMIDQLTRLGDVITARKVDLAWADLEG